MEQDNNPSLNTIENVLAWLETRIKKTTKEREKAIDLNLKIGKGAKLCVYKECLNYIRVHK